MCVSVFLDVQGYRYLSGVNVEQSCESALAYYSRVAMSGEEVLLYKVIQLVLMYSNLFWSTVASELPLISVAPVGKPRVFEEDSQVSITGLKLSSPYSLPLFLPFISSTFPPSRCVPQSQSGDEFDEDLRQYYELLADKGELQAQVSQNN